MRVTILDYGVGNLHSLETAIAAAGATPTVAADPAHACEGDVLVLPGVGAFAPAAARLAAHRRSLRDRILAGHPTLGICLGMQLLFEESDEGPGAGLGVFAGRVTRLAAQHVPHIGWNSLDDATDPAVRVAGLGEVYYAHSFACRPSAPGVVSAWTEHECDRFPAVVRRACVRGVQFHPEKSSAPGVAFLHAALRDVTEGTP